MGTYCPAVCYAPMLPATRSKIQELVLGQERGLVNVFVLQMVSAFHLMKAIDLAKEIRPFKCVVFSQHGGFSGECSELVTSNSSRMWAMSSWIWSGCWKYHQTINVTIDNYSCVVATWPHLHCGNVVMNKSSTVVFLLPLAMSEKFSRDLSGDCTDRVKYDFE